MLQYVYNLQDLRTITLQLTALYTYRHPQWVFPTIHTSRTRRMDSNEDSEAITDMQDYSTDTSTGKLQTQQKSRLIGCQR